MSTPHLTHLLILCPCFMLSLLPNWDCDCFLLDQSPRCFLWLCKLPALQEDLDVDLVPAFLINSFAFPRVNSMVSLCFLHFPYVHQSSLKLSARNINLSVWPGLSGSLLDLPFFVCLFFPPLPSCSNLSFAQLLSRHFMICLGILFCVITHHFVWIPFSPFR